MRLHPAISNLALGLLVTGMSHMVAWAQPGPGGGGPGRILRPLPNKKMPGRDEKAARRIAEIERFDQMPPEERKRALDRLPPERRQRIEQGLEQYRNMNPANRERLRNFERMSPQQRDNVRQNFQRMQELSTPRRILVRRELQQLRGLTAEERETRLQSESFRKRFDEEEQSIIRDTVVNLPPLPPQPQPQPE